MGGFSTHVGAPPFIETCDCITFADSPYEVVTDDHIIYCNAADGDIIVNLPSALTNEGRSLSIKKIDPSAHSITVDGFGTQAIDGQLTNVITVQYDSITINADDGNWWII